jgi:hypothetical protein
MIRRRSLLAGLGSGLILPAAARARPLNVRRFSRGLYRPPGWPRIDWTSPLTSMLAQAYHLDGSNAGVYSSTAGAESNAPRLDVMISDKNPKEPMTFSAGYNQTGGCCRFNGTSQYIYTEQGTFTGPSFISSIAEQTSYLIVASLTAVNATKPSIIFAPGGETPGSKFIDWGFATDSTDFYLTASDGTYSMAGTFSQGATLGQPFTVIFTLNCAAPSATCYTAHGVSSTITGSTAMSPDMVGTTTIGSDAGNVNGDYLNGDVMFCAWWNRALSTQEINSLLIEPFQFLIFPDDDLLAEMQ